MDVTPFDIRLDLLGRIADGPLAVVHGATEQGSVTLSDCWFASGRFSSSGYERQHWIIEAALIGVHASRLEIEEARISPDYLGDWAPGAFDELTQTDDAGTRTTLMHTAVGPLTAELADASVRLEHTGEVRESGKHDRVLQHAPAFVVRPASALTLDEVMERFVRPLQNLLTLAAGRAAGMDRFSVTIAHSALANAENPFEESVATVHFAAVLEKRQSEGQLFDEKLIFTVDAFGDSFSQFMVRWFEADKQLRHSLDLFFANHYAPPRYAESRFLLFAQALEVYHGQRYESRRRPEAEHLQRVQVVLDALRGLPQDQRDWVRVPLLESNRKSLRDRVTDLVAATAPGTRAALGAEATLPTRVSATRNYFTHYGDDKAAATSGRPLLALTSQLRLLIHSLLLRELGFTDEKVDRMLARSSLLRRTVALTQAPPDS